MELKSLRNFRILRHTLDASSPLLRREIRTSLREKFNGSWDASLDNHRFIRGALVPFGSIRIILTGSSALTRSEISAEKIYTYGGASPCLALIAVG